MSHKYEEGVNKLCYTEVSPEQLSQKQLKVASSHYERDGDNPKSINRLQRSIGAAEYGSQSQSLLADPPISHNLLYRFGGEYLEQQKQWKVG